ncbi:protein phosphatase 2C domain-containing protein [Pseudonocardia kujensis]|nr:protein phosphatase 2C domain-containing protein [Pseudonocardia kujensis]
MVILDGASSHSSEAPPADEYVDALLPALLARVDDGDLREQLRDALVDVTARLDLTAGEAPSSTVLILRVGEELVEVAALGDSTALVGHPDGTTSRVTDDRLQHVGADQRCAYRDALGQGEGFGEAHRARMRELQRSERPHRNRPDGYWIAEADPAAADELVVRTFPTSAVSWVVLATDGIQKHLDRLDAWTDAASRDSAELSALLADAQEWESAEDPDGQRLPRSKPHDDKTIAVWRAPA